MERLRLWACEQEAEVEAVGLSPQRATLLRARVPFHLAFRGASRASVALDGPAPIGRHLALAACAAWDVAEAVRLSRDSGLRLGRRLVGDVLDVAAWSAVADRSYTAVPASAVPLITEAALRYQWTTAPVLVVHAMAVAAARRLAHKPLQVTNRGHHVLAFLFGLGLRRVERATAQRIGTGFEAECRAAELTASLAGQYRVARSTFVVRGEPMNPHDVLSGVRLHFPSARSEAGALQELAWGGRKSALEALATRRAVQLDTALRAWKRDTNRRRTAIADQVLDPTLPEGHGMTLLSGEQVGHLASWNLWTCAALSPSASSRQPDRVPG